MLCTLTIVSTLFQTNTSSITMYPNGFDNIFDKLDNFFHSSIGSKKMYVPEEEFLENEYLQEYFLEDEYFLENPEAQQFYKDYLDR